MRKLESVKREPLKVKSENVTEYDGVRGS